MMGLCPAVVPRGCEAEQRLSLCRAAGLVEAWAQGAGWEAVTGDTDLDSGDVARLLSRTTDLLRQACLHYSFSWHQPCHLCILCMYSVLSFLSSSLPPQLQCHGHSRRRHGPLLNPTAIAW